MSPRLKWAIETAKNSPHLWSHEHGGTPLQILIEAATPEPVTAEQVDHLMHALGQSHPESPLGWRNHFCANHSDPDCEALVANDLMVRGTVSADQKVRQYHANLKHPLIAAMIAWDALRCAMRTRIEVQP